jgi:tripartite-type tricarboxylate transporter receptor subunit TctC
MRRRARLCQFDPEPRHAFGLRDKPVCANTPVDLGSETTQMDRRRFVIGSAASALAASGAFAQEAFPSHAITIVNAFPPGGANDIVTRPLATAMEPILKQPVVVETKAGAAGQVGAQFVASAKPDGYTLLSHNTGISGYAQVDKLFGRPVKTSRADFIPLARLVADPVLLLVNDQQPYKTLKEFIDAAKAHPDTLVFSSGGLYGASHLPLAYLEKATGPLHLRHLPTNGGGPAIVAILGNNAQVTTQTVSATLPHVKAGKLRPLATFGATRSKVLPDVPTLKELGYDVEYYLWVGIFAPKGTPPAITATLRAAIGKAAQTDAFKATLANIGLELAYLDGPDFQKFWDIDGAKTDEAVIAIGRQG